MSGQTDISQINNKLSTDEEEIVDSILSEINESGDDKSQQMAQQQMAQQQMAQQQMAQQQMAQQQMAQQQMAKQQMAQQQMAQQQMAQQQMAQQQMANGGQRMPNGQMMQDKMGMPVPVPPTESGMEKLLKDVKDPIAVVMLVLMFCLPQVDELLKNNIASFNNDGTLSMMGVLLKSVLAGALFYFIKMYT